VEGGQIPYLLILTEEYEVDLDTSRMCVCVFSNGLGQTSHTSHIGEDGT